MCIAASTGARAQVPKFSDVPPLSSNICKDYILCQYILYTQATTGMTSYDIGAQSIFTPATKWKKELASCISTFLLFECIFPILDS